MKTYRDLINSRLRWHPWLVPSLPIFVAIFLSALFIRLDLVWLSIVLAIPLSAWGIYAAYKLGKCPKCGAQILSLFGYHTRIYISRSLLPEKVKYCPICGLNFNLPCPEHTSDPKP